MHIFMLCSRIHGCCITHEVSAFLSLQAFATSYTHLALGNWTVSVSLRRRSACSTAMLLYII